MLKVGDVAPEIDAMTSAGVRFKLSEQRTKLCTIVYFFPKAFTPGCTLEGKHFRDNFAEMRLSGAALVGVSTDDHDTQCMFASSLHTPVPMIGDSDKSIARAYGVLWPMLPFARRVTYVVGPSQRIEAVFHHELHIAQHRHDVLQVIDQMRQERSRASSLPPSLGGIGDYDLVNEAGSGAMGVVYRARERATGRVLALKVLSARGDTARFALETMVLSRVMHPNIVGYVAHGTTDDGRFYMVMEWLDGETLSERLKRERPSLDESVRVAKQIARALGAAHQNGVVHRDIKPSNVLMTREGDVKLVDFGIARSLQNLSTKLTRTGHLVGTPGYAAPEQVRSDAVGPRADLYALGCLMYRCVEGRPPFDAQDTFQLLYATLHQETPRLTSGPPALAELVYALMSKDPAQRPESAEAVLARLEAL